MSGCGADGSALPWGGRGRGFKSRHSDQNRVFMSQSVMDTIKRLYKKLIDILYTDLI